MIDLFSLSTEELINLRNKIDLILEMRVDNDTELFYSIVRERARLRGTNLPQFFMIPDLFKKKISKTLVNLKSHYGLSKENMIELFQLFGDIMVDYLFEQEIPVSVKTIFENSDKFDSLFEQAFPSYHTKFFMLKETLNGKREAYRKSKANK